MNIFNINKIKYTKKTSPVDHFSWHTSESLSDIANSKDIIFHVRSLDPGKYSYPYHSHRNAEEMMVILSGCAMLRTPDKIKKVSEGDILFFEVGSSGAHQLYNHSDAACKYLDIRTNRGMDVCDYPDSNKVNILNEQEIYFTDSSVSYFDKEDKINEIWKKHLSK